MLGELAVGVSGPYELKRVKVPHYRKVLPAPNNNRGLKYAVRRERVRSMWCEPGGACPVLAARASVYLNATVSCTSRPKAWRVDENGCKSFGFSPDPGDVGVRLPSHLD